MAADRNACLLPPGCVSGTPLGVALYSSQKTHVPVGTRTASGWRTQPGKVAFGSSRNHLRGMKCVATTAQPLMPMADIANQLGGLLP